MRARPEVVVAVSRDPGRNAWIDREHAFLSELSRTHRVVPIGARCFDAPGRSAIAAARQPLIRDRRAFLMRYIDGAHVFPLHGVDRDPHKLRQLSAMYRNASSLGILASAERLATLLADLVAVRQLCLERPRCTRDLQGLIEARTGHFYLSDPSPQTHDRPPKLDGAIDRLTILIDGLRETEDRLLRGIPEPLPPARARAAPRPQTFPDGRTGGIRQHLLGYVRKPDVPRFPPPPVITTRTGGIRQNVLVIRKEPGT